MDDYKYLNAIKNINTHNEFINYIVERVASDKYRGIQCSQHNRLTFDYFSTVLGAIYAVAGEAAFDIHTGDFKGEYQQNAATYYRVVESIKSSCGKGTVNSVKKNTFPDIARMGFLLRYSPNGSLVNEGLERGSVASVQLSEKGVRFVNAPMFEKIKLFTDGVDIILKNAASQLVEIMYLNEYDIDSIDILEFMYIISDNRPEIKTVDKLNLLLEYRALSPLDKSRLDELLKAYCNPQNRKKYHNKTALRDYSNWKNESQQIYTLLANSTYFKVENNILILNTGDYGIFDTPSKRGAKAKSDYYKMHGVNKRPGYELHHIVPFSRARNKKDAGYIDDSRNLIYLSSDKHMEFTANNNKNVKMHYTKDNPDILFMDFGGGYIIVNIGSEALVAGEKIPEMLAYNQKLIGRFYMGNN